MRKISRLFSNYWRLVCHHRAHRDHLWPLRLLVPGLLFGPRPTARVVYHVPGRRRPTLARRPGGNPFQRTHTGPLPGLASPAKIPRPTLSHLPHRLRRLSLPSRISPRHPTLHCCAFRLPPHRPPRGPLGSHRLLSATAESHPDALDALTGEVPGGPPLL